MTDLHLITTDQRLMAEISSKLDQIVDLLGASGKEAPAAPEPGVAPDEKPAAKKAPVKKAATRKRVTGQ